MTQQRFVVQDRVNVAKTELSSLVDILHDFLKFFDKGSKCLQIPLPKHKIEMNLQSRKTTSLLITMKISSNIQIDLFVYRSDLETTILASSPSKSLNYTVIILNLQKLSTLTIANFSTSTKTDIMLQTSVK